MSGSESSGRHHPSRLLGKVLGRKLHGRSQSSLSDSDRASGMTDRSDSRIEEREKKLEEQREFERQVQLRRRKSEERAKQEETAEERSRYGVSDIWAVDQHEIDPMVDLQVANEAAVEDPAMLDALYGESRRYRARIHVIRPVGASLMFLVLRDRGITLQTVISEKNGWVTPHMLHWARRLHTESLITVQGILQKPKDVVTGCSITHLELNVTHIYLISANREQLPFSVYTAERDAAHALEEHHDFHEEDSKSNESHSTNGPATDRDSEHGPIISMRTRLNNRLVDLRTPTAQAIFRVQSAVGMAFRQYLMAQSFIEIHSPKLQGGASESGSSVFQVRYFGRSAFLAQSPQLYKQMCIAADMKRVFEIGPVFRAENSNTPRHMTEYTGLDLEMEVNHYYDALRVIDGMLKHIFSVLKNECHDLVQTVRRTFPSSELVWLDESLVLPFPEGIRMLREAGYREEDGSEPSEFEDLATRAEIRLGQLVKEQYGTDYYILDKFPASARPFYTLPDEHDKRRTNSFDIFVRGQEICTGGQRIHNAEMLEDRIRELGIDTHSLEEYLEGFRLGAPPHAGCGIGLERFVMLYLNLDDIRLASLFYRDPKSFAVRKRSELRYPEASTNPPPWRRQHESNIPPSNNEHMQPLEKLIANYGDSSNTSWLDDRFQVWRDVDTGAAVGYAVRRHYAFAVGDPLCESMQYSRVIARFLSFLKEKSLKPVWLMVGEPVEQILGGQLGWCTLTCTADQRLADVSKNDARHDPETQRKIRHAHKVGVTFEDVPLNKKVPSEVVEECNKQIRAWHASRKGTQVHLTEIQPWVDQEHRSYFIARDQNKQVCCLVVLAQLSPEHGYQVKWAMSFPGAPSGAIEATIFKALDSIGSSPATFGTAATAKLRAIYGLSGIGFRVLSHIYENVVERASLLNKGEFREKLGTTNDPTYVCYPKGGLSMLGVRDIIDFFRD
ncbi:aspartate--tRNA ligase [Malassezia psittaci]|uniref:Probable aspartate--tRNA ligase, cytoplasmic n=1 Tax=Malassezia psittaci TaxID=1821823 RepID=A0AAF0FIP7_9BASI|nr:aspartate--tRNA ligase [Malassezia psittaci]